MLDDTVHSVVWVLETCVVADWRCIGLDGVCQGVDDYEISLLIHFLQSSSQSERKIATIK